MYIHTYMHACMHACMHTGIQTSNDMYVRNANICTHTCMNSHITYIALHCIAFRCITFGYIRCSAFRCITLRYIALYYIALHYIALHLHLRLHLQFTFAVTFTVTLHYTLRCVTLLHYVTLRNLASHYVAQPYVAVRSTLLIGGLEHFILCHILGTIIPFDFYIFQRGRYTTNQITLLHYLALPLFLYTHKYIHIVAPRSLPSSSCNPPSSFFFALFLEV